MDVGPLLLLNKQEATSTSSQEGVNALKVSEVSLLVQSGVGLEAKLLHPKATLQMPVGCPFFGQEQTDHPQVIRGLSPGSQATLRPECGSRGSSGRHSGQQQEYYVLPGQCWLSIF